MSRESDLRRHARAEKASPIQISWPDRSGVDRVMNGKCVDVSESGMRVEVPESIDRQTYVTIQSTALALHGRASVRTCTRKGMKYILGLEFSGGLHWKPKS